MANESQIDASGIDATYPVAGKDNDSQGFRDNFQIIKSGLLQSKDELDDLIASSARLDGGEYGYNDFNWTVTKKTVFQNCADEVLPEVTATTTSNTIIDCSLAPYQKVRVQGNGSGTATITIQGFPENNLTLQTKKLGKVRVEFIGEGDQPKVTFRVQGATPTGIKRSSSTPATISLSASTPTIVEFWSYDGGVNVFAHSLGQFSST